MKDATCPRREAKRATWLSLLVCDCIFALQNTELCSVDWRNFGSLVSKGCTILITGQKPRGVAGRSAIKALASAKCSDFLSEIRVLASI